MSQEKPVSELTRRAEDIVTCSHALEKKGIKPASISVNEKYALICVDYSPAVQRLGGISCGITWLRGSYWCVYQALLLGVVVKWLEPYEAQPVAGKVH